MDPAEDHTPGARLMRAATWVFVMGGFLLVFVAVGQNIWRAHAQQRAMEQQTIEQIQQVQRALREWNSGRAERQHEAAEYQECMREAIAAQKAINAKLAARAKQVGVRTER